MYRSPDLIRELNNFEHLSTYQIETFFLLLLRRAVEEDGCFNTLRYYDVMMFELDGTPRRDVQSLAARYIIELFTKHLATLMTKTARS